MKKIVFAVAAGVATIVSASAMASSPIQAGTYYVNPGFGTYITDNRRDIPNGGAANLSLGYNLPSNFAAQLGLTAMSPNGPGYSVRAEGLYNIPTASGFIPYLAVGVGALKVNGVRAAFDSGLGVKYFINDRVGFSVDYRNFLQMGPELRHDNMITMGLVWNFGGMDAMAPAHEYTPIKLDAQQQQAVNQAKKTLQYVLPKGVEQCGVNGATPMDGCITISGNQVTMHLDVKFQQNKDVVSSQYAPAIDRLATFMNTYSSTDATLFGYASSEGPLAFNQKLSLHRADQVKRYLVAQKGIAASRLKTVGMGIKNPIANNDTAAGREANRRVEAAVVVPMQQQ